MCITTQEGSSCPQQVAEPLALLALLTNEPNKNHYIELEEQDAFYSALVEAGFNALGATVKVSDDTYIVFDVLQDEGGNERFFVLYDAPTK